MQCDPVPTLAELPEAGQDALQLDLPLNQISITIPYAVTLFNKRYYWQTHEVLEDLWMDEYGPMRAFLQGFIQGAAAMYHVVAQNSPGYERLSRLSREKLSTFKKPQLGVDLSACLDAFLVFDQSQQNGTRFDLTKLPKITFAGITL